MTLTATKRAFMIETLTRALDIVRALPVVAEKPAAPTIYGDCKTCNHFAALSGKCFQWGQTVPRAHRANGCEHFDDTFKDDQIDF